MTDIGNSLPSVSKEVQDFASASENLISIATTPHAIPLTEQEVLVVQYYLLEITKAIPETTD